MDVKEINGITWERTDFDTITAYKDDKIIGYISQHDGREWKEIEKGADPIQERWEDGAGNPVSADGWGEMRNE